MSIRPIKRLAKSIQHLRGRACISDELSGLVRHPISILSGWMIFGMTSQKTTWLGFFVTRIVDQDYHVCAGWGGRAAEAMHRQLCSQPDKLEERHLRHYAKQIGLDLNRFDREMAGGAYSAQILDHYYNSLINGITGVPITFITVSSMR